MTLTHTHEVGMREVDIHELNMSEVDTREVGMMRLTYTRWA